MALLLLKVVFLLFSIGSSQSLEVNEGGSTADIWSSCLNKCLHLSAVMIQFDAVQSYCDNLSSGARPVDFGAKSNGTIATELGGCRNLKIEKGQPYWVNKKFTTNKKCRTISFVGSNLFENQAFPCTSPAHPMCEADIKLCENTINQSGNGEWGALDNTTTYYHTSTNTFSYCDAVAYCESMQTHLADIATKDYSFQTQLWSVLHIKAGDNFVIWTKTLGITCPVIQANATTIRYVGAMVHMPTQAPVAEKHIALCESPWIPTTTTLTTTTTPTTTSTTTTTPTTTTPTTTTPTTTSTPKTTTTPTTTTPTTTTSTTTTTPTTTKLTTTTTPSSTTPQTSTPKPDISQTPDQTCIGKKIAVSDNDEPLWLQVGDHEYFINYDCVKNECPVSCTKVKQRNGKSFCEGLIDSFQVLHTPTNYKGHDYWIGGRVKDMDIIHDGAVKYLEYIQKPVRLQLPPTTVRELWQELRKQRRQKRVPGVKP